MMTVYKVSYVVKGSNHPGAIVNMDRPPNIGERVRLGTQIFEVVEVLDLLPPRGDYHYMHATCQSLDRDATK